MANALSPGTVIAQRFFVLGLIGGGGMGMVYRARDEQTGSPVAIKFLRGDNKSPEAIRFKREAQLLSELEHPGIVRYIAQGTTPAGQLYLVMEWLDGEDLSRRLIRQQLSLSQCLQLLSAIACGLSVAHRRGIIHRDLKPSNLFLRAGQIENVAILDFGIARSGDPAHAKTITGVVIGTPEYMAPEQARGKHEILPATDVFALGCVLFECLTGRPPFLGRHIPATLAKVLYHDPPPLRELRPEVPEPIAHLLYRMLAKEPAARPHDADALLAELSALERLPDKVPSPLIQAPARREYGMSHEKMQFATVLMVTLCGDSSNAETPGEATTVSAKQFSVERGVEENIRSFLAFYGVPIEVLADGSIVATLPHREKPASDQATRGACCALFIKALWPASLVVLASGRGNSPTLRRQGESLKHVGRLLRGGQGAGGSDSLQAVDCVLIDELTAGLIAARFRVCRYESGIFALVAETSTSDPCRPIFGKPMPCIGRDVELEILQGVFSRSARERTSGAVLVSATVGMGKSRLCHEFLRRIKAPKEGMLVLFARGEQMDTGSMYSLIGQALLRLCGTLDTLNPEVRCAELRKRVSQNLPAAQAGRVVTTLTELCRIREEINPRQQTMPQQRGDLFDHARQAFIDFLRAECRVHPVLLVLDDVHFGDSLSTHLVEAALRELENRPFMVLALARSGVGSAGYMLQAKRLLHINLQPLGKLASGRLVQQIEDPHLHPASAARIVERAGGNPLFLEEFIRAAVAGKGDEVPDTVLSMMQARLYQLESLRRHVLCVGSVFGDRFSLDGVAALLGPVMSRDELLKVLEELIAGELIKRCDITFDGGASEFYFLHTLMRDALYSLLTDEERTLGHYLAGMYLEHSAPSDSLVIADHYIRGGEPQRAALFYVRAADATMSRDDAALLRSHSI